MKKLIVFQRFTNRDEATTVGNTLGSNGIAWEIEEERALLDENIVGRQYNDRILLKINSEDFSRAKQLLLDATEVDLSQVEKGYMLLSLSNDELRDVVAKPDEWGAYNYKLALALLAKRGVELSPERVDELETRRVQELSAPRELNAAWLLFGYGFSLLGIVARLLGSPSALFVLYSFYLIPGVLGIILGLYIRYTSVTLPDGRQVFSFSAGARRHGMYMILVGVLSFALLAVGAAAFNEPLL
jgi:hypothetical protein